MTMMVVVVLVDCPRCVYFAARPMCACRNHLAPHCPSHALRRVTFCADARCESCLAILSQERKELACVRDREKKCEEYDEELHKISKQIHNVIYEEIISDLQTIYNEYIFDGSISNSCYEVYLFGIMEIEYFKLIKYLKNNNKYTLST